LSDDLEVTRVLAGYIVMRGDKKIGGPFNSWRAALERLDCQKPKRADKVKVPCPGSATADLDARNT
jgi:hypothetical protein